MSVSKYLNEAIANLLMEVKPKVLSNTSPHHPLYKTDAAHTPTSKRAASSVGKILGHVAPINTEDAFKAVSKEGIGEADHVVYAHKKMVKHNGRDVAAVHIGTYHGINNKRDLGMDDDGESEEIFHHIVHRIPGSRKLGVYQTSAAKNWGGGLDENFDAHGRWNGKLPQNLTPDELAARQKVNDAVTAKLRANFHKNRPPLDKDKYGNKGETDSKAVHKAEVELKESVDPLHQKLRALGYKKDSAESTPGEKKTWWRHPSGTHPHGPADLAKKLGHTFYDEEHNYDTVNQQTGERTSHQGRGLLFLGQPKKNREGKNVRRDYDNGLDPSARYEEVELKESGYPSLMAAYYHPDKGQHTLWNTGNYQYALHKSAQDGSGKFPHVKSWNDHDRETVHKELIDNGYKPMRQFREDIDESDLKESTKIKDRQIVTPEHFTVRHEGDRSHITATQTHGTPVEVIKGFSYSSLKDHKTSHILTSGGAKVDPFKFKSHKITIVHKPGVDPETHTKDMLDKAIKGVNSFTKSRQKDMAKAPERAKAAAAESRANVKARNDAAKKKHGLTDADLKRVTHRQIGGDDGYQHTVLIDNRPFINGLTRPEVPYYVDKAHAHIAKRKKGLGEDFSTAMKQIISEKIN